MNFLQRKPVPPILQKAQWISADNPSWDLYNCYALFRRSFSLRKASRRAVLAITADQSYQLYVNGHYVCRGPARGFQSHWPYDKVDVAPWLKPGKNVLAVRAYHPGISNFQYISRGFSGLLVAGSLDGKALVSDGHWKCRRQKGITRGTLPASLQLFPQEHIDLRAESPDWMQPDYHDEDWPRATYLRPWNAEPWSSLEERGIPFLTETPVSPKALAGVQRGTCRAGFSTTRDVVSLRDSEGWKFEPASKAPVPLHVPPSGREHFTSYLVDFGRTQVGPLEIHIGGARGGEIIDAIYAETLSENPLRPDMVINGHCRLALGGRLVCKRGSNPHRFFHLMGFRYLVLTVRGNSGKLRIDYRLHCTGYPLRDRGKFQSSDAALERIWQACAWTQKCCSLDAYVDTPWREQAQWWGDARVQAWNTFHLDGDTRLFRRGIHCIASQTTSNGLTYGHAPTAAHECILLDFTLIWLLTLWDYYWQTGSLEPFLDYEPQIKDALAYFASQISSRTGLLRYDPRYWLFLDWTDLRKDGCSSVYSLWLLYTLDKLARLHALAGQEKESARIKRWARTLRTRLMPLINKNGLMRDGFTPQGRIDPETSVHAQTLAIMTRLCPQHTPAMVQARLLPAVSGPVKIPPSAYWITYIYSTLSERGHGRPVVEDIARRWLPMAEHGTTWENFRPRKGVESFSHAWSAHPLFHLMQILGGIRQSAPAWAEITYRPEFLGDHAAVTIPTPHGMIQSSWRKTGTVIRGKLQLPKNIRARVLLRGRPTTAAGAFHFEVD